MENYTYQIGGSLQNNAPCYVTREADRKLYNALKQGEFCYVLNSRQMGKSSLLVQTRHRLQQEGLKCTTIDMTRIGSENITALQWYKGIVTELWRGFNLLGKFNLKAWWRDGEEISFIQRLSNFIEDVLLVKFPEDNLVIFIDEIDSILSLEFSTDDLFALIRFCYNQRAINSAYNRIAFAIFGVATPSDLIADKKRTPFNIGNAIELEGFKFADSLPLAQGLEEKIDNSEAVLREILAWTGGQPFLTQKLCQLMLNLVAEKGNKEAIALPPGTESFWVESAVKARIIDKWESQDEPEHLRTIRDRIKTNPEKTGRLLGIYHKVLQNIEVNSDDSREQIELILSGLAVKSGGFLQVKNRIYQEVFNLEWVENQLGSLRPYSQTFDAWIASQQKDESRLLLGKALKDAQMWAMGKSLSDLDYQFLAASVEFDRKEVQNALEAERTKEVEARLKQEQKTARFQRLFLGAVSLALVATSVLAIAAWWQYRKARISELEALISSAEGLYGSNRRFESLVEAIRARKRRELLNNIPTETSDRLNLALTRSVFGTLQFNKLLGHQSTVLAIAFNPQDNTIATTSSDATIQLWDRDGRWQQSLDDHESYIYDVNWNPDGELLASGSADRTIRLWQKDGQKINTFKGHTAAVWKVVWHPNGKTLASASEDGTVRIWGLDGRELKKLTLGNAAAFSLAWSPDGSTLAAAYLDGAIAIWTRDGQLIQTMNHGNVTWDLAFSPDGTKLASVGENGQLKLWSPEGQLLKTVAAHEGPSRDFAFWPDGSRIVTTGVDNKINIWTPQGSLLQSLEIDRAGLRSVAVSPDGEVVATGSSDRLVRLWRPSSQLVTPLYGHRGTVWEVAIAPDSSSIASASADGTIALWRKDGTLLQTFNEPNTVVLEVVFSRDGSTIASGSSKGTVKLWQTNGTLLQTIQAHQAPVMSVAISPDNSIVASGANDSQIKLWQPDGSLLFVLKEHLASVRALTFSADGQTLISGSLDRTVKIWSRNGQLLKTLNGHETGVTRVVLSADGQTIASASADDIIKLWSIDGELQQTIKGTGGNVWGLGFTPDDRFIIVATVDGQIKVWRRDGTLLRTLDAHQGSVRGLAIAPNGEYIASGGEDNLVLLWNLNRVLNIDEMTYACDWVRDYLRTNIEVEEGDRTLCDGVGE